jgi:hypothetical protein
MRPRTVILIICVLGIIAFFENGILDKWRQGHAAKVATQNAHQQQQETIQLQKQEQQQADQTQQQQADAAHAQFLAQYTDTNFARIIGTKIIAIAVASEIGTSDGAVSAALTSRFKNEPVEIVSSFFRPAIIADGIFNEIYVGSHDVFNKLELSKSLDGLLLAREKSQYDTNPTLDNVLTASMELDVEVLPVSSQVQSQTWTFTANGAGFNKAAARQQAEERLIKQITTATNMTLN